MTLSLSHFVTEQRAVYVAEERLDHAEQELIAASRADRLAAARSRYRQALIDLDGAVARLEKRKCELAGRRHLRIASPLSLDIHPSLRGEPRERGDS